MFLPATVVSDIVCAIQPFEFDDTHKGFYGLDVVHNTMKVLGRYSVQSVSGIMSGKIPNTVHLN